MSTQQIQRCIRDVLGINDDEENDWTQGHMKKLMSATSTLYNTSLNKVMLKQGEETARCHLCAYIAAEKLAEKHVRDLHYYLDRVPLEPRKARNLLQLFQQNMFQSSPIKNFSWTPSPKKRRSPIKDGDRFTARDPKELREQLFGTPTKVDGRLPSPVKAPLPMTVSPLKSSPTKARRKLAFEEDLSEGKKSFKRQREKNELLMRLLHLQVAQQQMTKNFRTIHSQRVRFENPRTANRPGLRSAHMRHLPKRMASRKDVEGLKVKHLQGQI